MKSKAKGLLYKLGKKTIAIIHDPFKFVVD